MDILGAIFDSIGDATSSRKRISFTSYSVPYRAVKHLEQYGVKVWIGASPQREGDKVHCTIQVSIKQYKYASGLLAGLNDIVVTNPVNAKPIRPTKSWGKPPKAKGIAHKLYKEPKLNTKNILLAWNDKKGKNKMNDQAYSIEPIIIDQGELELQIHVEVTVLWVDKAKRVIALQKIKDSIAAEVLKVFGKQE